MRSVKRFARALLAASLVAGSLVLAAATDEEEELEEPYDPIRASQYWLDAARVYEAWEVTRGEGITIAVIDTGIGRGVDAFAGAVIGGTDVSGSGAVDGRTPVGVVDPGHGSRVASLAAGRENEDGTGLIGVAPAANLLSVSVSFGANASVPITEQIAKAIVWSVDNGADIINLSFTMNTLDWDPSWDEAFLYAHENDVLIVVAAGNRDGGTDMVGAPATIPGVLTVAGVDQTGTASEAASTQGITIGISAPSEFLLGFEADGELAVWHGTSGAAPIVAGVAALVRSAHPELDVANVINRIVKSAISVPGVRDVPDVLYGYGLVDAAAAVTDKVAQVSENPMGDLKEWVRLHRRAKPQLPAGEEPEVTVELPPLPAAEPPTEPLSPLTPNAETLRYGTLPLITLTVPAILVALGVAAATRRVRLARERTPTLSNN